jgi:N-acetylglucosaminyl-diphospho-decaprenol L-rhamnosyltransferase
MVAKTSVVIVTYHTGASLRLAVESTLAQAALKELVIVDNGNPEESLAWLRGVAEANKKVTLLTGHGNIGFGAACNLGAAQCSGEFILLLNPDSLLPENALRDMQDALANKPEFWAAGGQMVNADGTEQRGSRRRLLTPRTAISESLYLYRLLGWERMNQHKEPLPETPTQVEAISGAFVFIRRDHYEGLNGMDEKYFIHVEDMDFCRRINEAGGKILFVPLVKVLHLKSTSKVSSAFVEYHKTKGFILYHQKFYPPLVWILMAAGLWARFLVKLLVLGALRVLPEKEDRKAVRRVLWLHEYLREPKDEMAEYKDKTVMVTGATSQIGIGVIGRLLAQGAKVIALRHKTDVYFNHPNLTWISVELKNDTVDLQNQKADALIHCAPLWLLDPLLTPVFNAKVKRVIAFSSTSVFVKLYSSNKSERQLVERLEKAELNLAERCRKSGGSFTIFRPTMIYGLGLDENVTRIAEIAQRYHFFPLYPPAKGRRQPVHADDLAQVALANLDNAKTFNKSYNIGGGEVLTYQAMVEKIFGALGQTPRTVMFKYLPEVLDILGKWLLGGKVNGEMARRMNEDMLFLDSAKHRDFSFKFRDFLTKGKRDLGQL